MLLCDLVGRLTDLMAWYLLDGNDAIVLVYGLTTRFETLIMITKMLCAILFIQTKVRIHSSLEVRTCETPCACLWNEETFIHKQIQYFESFNEVWHKRRIQIASHMFWCRNCLAVAPLCVYSLMYVQ